MKYLARQMGVFFLSVSWISYLYADDFDKKLVYIKCQNDGKPSQGTGVLVSSKGHVLTAKHVVLNSSSSKCDGIIENNTVSKNSRKLDIIQISSSENEDAALLHFSPSTNDESFPYIKYCKLDDKFRNREVIARGWPDATVGVASSRPGFIYTTTPDNNGTIQTSVETTHGISGGPVVLDDFSCLIGIALGAKTDGRGLAAHYAVLVAERLANNFNLEQGLPGKIFNKCQNIKNRTKVILYPYHGIGGINTESSYSDLEKFLSDKVKTIGANFSNDPDAKYLEKLCVEKSPIKPNSLAEFIDEWRKQNALLQMEGIITKNSLSESENIAKSSIYFGDLKPILSKEIIPAVHTDLPLNANQYGTIGDTHSAAALFSLALNAKDDGLPSAYYLRLAGLARETLNTIKAEGKENKDIKEMRCTLERLISDTTNQPLLQECQ